LTLARHRQTRGMDEFANGGDYVEGTIEMKVKEVIRLLE
jgi:hypothetical protein